MSVVPIEVTIEGGKITPTQPDLLPEHGCGWLTLSPSAPNQPLPETHVDIAADGLPVFRGNGPIITSELVREIEGSIV